MPDIEVERYELHAGATYSFAPGRRDFCKLLGGGLVVMLALDFEAQAQRPGGRAMPPQIGAWLHIAESGAITVYTGKAEVGQNIRTSLTQAVAEELRVSPSQIVLVMGDTRLTPYDMGTFGSRTTPIMAPQLHKVAAAARQTLVGLAAAKWKVDGAQLAVADGRVSNGGTSVSFGELTLGQQLNQVITAEAAVTPATAWKVAGHPLSKVNARSIVTGQEKYTSDMVLPGMLHGRVVRPTAFKATLISADLKPAQSIPGVVAVRDGDFVGVACDDSAKLSLTA